MFNDLPVWDIDDGVLVRLGEAMVPSLAVGTDLDTPLGTPDDDENVATLANGELRLPAGYTYFGQFVDHDITFDPVSSLARQTDPDALTDFRTPRFDLDSLYGRGSSDQPYLYDRDGVHLLLQATQPADPALGFPDLQRNVNGRALIGDPRNDENHIVSQLQVAVIRFHNAVVDKLQADSNPLTGNDLFKKAQQLVRWHYQWVVVHDFLPRIVGDGVVPDILRDDPWFSNGASVSLDKVKLRFFHWEKAPYMPVEFSVAAYRYGHSVIRSSYNLNMTAVASPANANIHRIPIFSTDLNPLASLAGMSPIPADWDVDWHFFLPNITGPEPRPDLPQPSYKVDADLASPLMPLPTTIAGPDAAPVGFPQTAPNIMQSLAVRNLLRAKRLQLPSGQDVARAMGVTPIDEATLYSGNFAGLSDADKTALDGKAPLWFYILREADVVAGTEHLGPVGGRIVAEVLIGLLAGDPLSYLNIEPNWVPTLPPANAAFSLSDLINFGLPALPDPAPTPYPA
jgi:Animal haem peroxidase